MSRAAWIMMLATWTVVSAIAGRLFFAVLRSKSPGDREKKQSENEPSSGATGD